MKIFHAWKCELQSKEREKLYSVHASEPSTPGFILNKTDKTNSFRLRIERGTNKPHFIKWQMGWLKFTQWERYHHEYLNLTVLKTQKLIPFAALYCNTDFCWMWIFFLSVSCVLSVCVCFVICLPGEKILKWTPKK